MSAISNSLPATTTTPIAGTSTGTMRAIQQRKYGSTDVLQLGTAARPTPAPGEVVVRIEAAGLDRGIWHLMTGRPYLMRIMGFGFFGPKNTVPGHDLAGTVVEVGPGVSRFRVGDAVFGIGLGSFAEYACASENKLSRKPAALSFEEAAVLGISGLTALQALRSGGVQPGERVLVVGASGGVGTFAVQLAKAFGAEVTGVCSTRKVELVRSIGADHVIDYSKGSLAEHGRIYDVILDIGGNTRLATLRSVLAESGRLVFVGGENGGDWTAGFGRQLRAFAIAPFVRHRFVQHSTREHFEGLEELLALADAGRIKPVIDRRVGLADVVTALRDLEAGRVAGKVVVRVGTSS